MLIEVNKVGDNYEVTPNVTPGGGLQPDLGIVYDGLDYYYDETEEMDYIRVKTSPSGQGTCVYTTSPRQFFANMSQDNGLKCIILNQSGTSFTESFEITGGFGEPAEWEFNAGDRIRIGYTGDSLRYQDNLYYFSDYWLLPYLEHTVTQQEVDELNS